MRLPPQLKNQYDQLVQAEQRLRTFSSQKTQLEVQKATIETALSELEKAKETNPDVPVYKNAGAVMIKATKLDDVLEELKEKQELIEMRLKTVTKQIERINTQYEQMRQQFQQSIQQMSQSQDFKTPM